jgi:hypothetical protein
VICSFLSVAQRELADSIDHYNRESEGLGFEFAAEVQRALSRIIRHPLAWAPLSKRTRRYRLNRFPYGIVYQIRPGEILIVSVMHLHRHPMTWKSREKA